MLNLGCHRGLETHTEQGAAQGQIAQQGEARHPAKPIPLREKPKRLPPVQRAPGLPRKAHPPASDAGTGHREAEEWTSHDAYDYALKRAAGYIADEERVAVAIFYSLFPDPGSCYAAMDEHGKERMRWCARAAIATLSEKR